MSAFDELRALFDQFFEMFEPRREFDRGILGNAQGDLYVAGDAEGRVWFRKNGQDSQLAPVPCWLVRPMYDLPVVCGERPEEPGLYQVLSWDRSSHEGEWAGMSSVAPHGETHQWYSDADDTVYVWTRAMMPFRVSPGGGLLINVSGPDVYLWGTGWNTWSPLAGYNLAGGVPANPNQHAFSLVYIDGVTNLLGTTHMVPVNQAVAITPNMWPAPTAGQIPLALVYFVTGQTVITEDDIVDARVWLGTGGGGLTPGAHNLIDSTVHGDTQVYAALVQGDIPFATAGLIWDKLAIGGAGQVLTVAGGLPTWAAPGAVAHNMLSVTHSDTPGAVAVVAGDLMYGDGTPDWNRLPIGAGADVLTVVGGAPAWQAPAGAAHNILSATHTDTPGAAAVVRGDVLRGDATPDWNRLALGTQGFFFKSDGTDANWQRISAQTVTVGPSTTCDYATLGAAIADFGVGLPNPTAAAPWVVLMFGGVYAEAGNITIPSYCWVMGMGEGTQINMGTGNDITFSADSGMESCYVYGDPTIYLLGTTADGVVWRDVRAHLTTGNIANCFYVNGSGNKAEAYQCIASSADTRAGFGFYAADGELYCYDCEADDMDDGFSVGSFVTSILRTKYCSATNCTRDFYNQSYWYHTKCEGLRTSIGTADLQQVRPGYTHWPNGTYLDMDFTGTDWDLKGECNYVGLRFSDVATPFPDILTWTHSGTWAHSAGNGWVPTMTVNNQGPAILVPLMRPGNWELFIDFEYTPGHVNQRFILDLGYLANSNHVGARANVRDDGAADSDLHWALQTNDGDDTWTNRYTGANIVGATGNYQIGFRCQNGCVGVYDDQNNSWNYYQGRQNTGASPYSAYTATHAFLQFFRYDANVPTLRIRNLRLTYLL
jgi:hypothetical protein